MGLWERDGGKFQRIVEIYKVPISSSPSGLSSCSVLLNSGGIQRPISSDRTAQLDFRALISTSTKKVIHIIKTYGSTIAKIFAPAPCELEYYRQTYILKTQKHKSLKANYIPASSCSMESSVPFSRVNRLVSFSFSLRQLSTASVIKTNSINKITSKNEPETDRITSYTNKYSKTFLEFVNNIK